MLCFKDRSLLFGSMHKIPLYAQAALGMLLLVSNALASPKSMIAGAPEALMHKCLGSMSPCT